MTLETKEQIERKKLIEFLEIRKEVLRIEKRNAPINEEILKRKHPAFKKVYGRFKEIDRLLRKFKEKTIDECIDKEKFDLRVAKRKEK